MSRYVIEAREQKHLTVAVGWDAPLNTLFAQVKDEQCEDEESEDAMPLWVGCTHKEIHDIAVLKELVRPWATIPQDIIDKLTVDMD